MTWLEMVLAHRFGVPGQCFFQYTGCHFNPANTYMPCKYICPFGKGSWLKMGGCGGWHCNSEQARKKERQERKDRTLKGERWTLGPVLRQDNQCSKQARGTVAAGNVVGTVRNSGGRRRKGVQGKDEGGRVCG